MCQHSKELNLFECSDLLKRFFCPMFAFQSMNKKKQLCFFHPFSKAAATNDLKNLSMGSIFFSMTSDARRAVEMQKSDIILKLWDAGAGLFLSTVDPFFFPLCYRNDSINQKKRHCWELGEVIITCHLTQFTNFSAVRFKPWTAGQEARTLPQCHKRHSTHWQKNLLSIWVDHNWCLNF